MKTKLLVNSRIIATKFDEKTNFQYFLCFYSTLGSETLMNLSVKSFLGRFEILDKTLINCDCIDGSVVKKCAGVGAHKI